MKCDIIRDLIPLCSDGLGSEESMKEIQEHIQTCESCRILYEKIPLSENAPPDTVPDEKKAFHKVNKKLRNNRLKIIILAILLIVIISAVGYFSFNQITKHPGTKSFETISQSIEIRRIAKYLADGNIEKFIDSISKAEFSNYPMNQDIMSGIKQSDIQKLQNAYNEFTKDNPIKSVHVATYYADYGFELAPIAYSDILLKTNNDEISFGMMKNTDGKYTISQALALTHKPNEKISTKLNNTLAYISNHKLINTDFLAKLICNKKQNSEKKAETISEFVCCRFNHEYREKVSHNMIDFYVEKNFFIEDLFFSHSQIDIDKNMFYYNLTITASDDKGRAVMNTRLYYDEYGLRSPEPDDIQIYTDNCSKALEESLKTFFG